MARMPGAEWQGEHGSLAMTRYDIFCIHTIVGRGPAHAAHFSPLADGRIIQSRDTSKRSAANLDGNHRVIASENEDHGDAFGGTPRLPRWVPLTDEQVEANAQIFAWLHKTHGIPLQLCPDSKPGSRGLAYHRQGVDGNFGPGTDYPNPGRVPGGEKWSSSAGKVCPTDVRINQLPAILARAIEIVNHQEDPMADSASQEKLDKILSTVNQIQRGQKTARENARKRDVALKALVLDALELARLDTKTDKTIVSKLNQIKASLDEALNEEDS